MTGHQGKDEKGGGIQQPGGSPGGAPPIAAPGQPRTDSTGDHPIRGDSQRQGALGTSHGDAGWSERGAAGGQAADSGRLGGEAAGERGGQVQGAAGRTDPDAGRTPAGRADQDRGGTAEPDEGSRSDRSAASARGPGQEDTGSQRGLHKTPGRRSPAKSGGTGTPGTGRV